MKLILEMNYKVYLMIFSFAFFAGCEKTEILLLCKKEINGENDEYYLVKNPSKEIEVFKQQMFEYNADLKKSKKFGSRTFLKVHENNIIDIVFSEKIDYA